MENEVNDDLIKIGERLKTLRKEKGFTSYRRFADENDIEPKVYWKIEEGKSDFKYSSLKRILTGLDLTVAEFFKEL